MFWFFRLEAVIFCSGIFAVTLFVLSKVLINKFTDLGFNLQLRNERQKTSEDLLVREYHIASLLQIAVMTFCIGIEFTGDNFRTFVFRGTSVQQRSDFSQAQTTMGRILIAVGAIQYVFTIALFAVPHGGTKD